MKIRYPFLIAFLFFLTVGNLAHADERSTAIYDCCTITTLNAGTDTSTTVALPLSDKECQKRNSSIAHVTAFYTEGTVSDDQRSCIRKSSGASGEWEEAQPSEPIKTPFLSVKIPELKLTDSTCDSESCSSPWLSEYIQGLYKYGIAAVSILAALALMIAGLFWLTAGGNTERIASARKWIQASLAGLLIVYSPYLLLSVINGSLLKLTPIKIAYIQNESLDSPGPIVSTFPSDGRTHAIGPVQHSLALAPLPTGYTRPDWISYFATPARADSCNFELHLDNQAPNLDNGWLAKGNGVPEIFCPHQGGIGNVRNIAYSILQAGKAANGVGMITYRFGGKGGPPPYNSVAAGDTVDHTCSQDIECADQIKGHENEKSNCTYCCPPGQACLDCSAFVNHILSCAGIPIVNSYSPAMTSCAESLGDGVKTVDLANNKINGIELIPGDLLTVKNKKGTTVHVIMYIGNGETAESKPGDNDTGRRPGKGLVITSLSSQTYSFAAVLRVKKALGTTCQEKNTSCDKSSECCGNLLCSNGFNNGGNSGTCKTCIANYDFNCSYKRDCCDRNAKCVKQPSNLNPAGDWRCQPGCIADFQWDCEEDSDCCGAGNGFRCVAQNNNRNKCTNQ